MTKYRFCPEASATFSQAAGGEQVVLCCTVLNLYFTVQHLVYRFGSRWCAVQYSIVSTCCLGLVAGGVKIQDNFTSYY